MDDEPDILKHIFVWRPMPYQGGPDLKRCRASVHRDGSFGICQCSRAGKIERAGHLFCSIHDPVAVKTKNAARKAAWDAEWAEKNRISQLEADRRKFRAACADALRIIAAGHNDPRSLAVETLSRDPDAIATSEAAE